MLNVRVTHETLNGINILIPNASWNEALPMIIKSLSKGGVIKVFSDDKLALVIHSDYLKNNFKLECFSRLSQAMKRYEMNIEAGFFHPVIEVA